MKAWIRTIFLLKSKIGQLVELIAEEMDALSVDIAANTLTVFTKMLALEDKKRRVVNFKVFSTLLKGQLEKQEYSLIKLHIVDGKSFEEIAPLFESSKSALSRKFNKAINKCEDFLIKLTFNEERLVSEYKDIALIYRTVQKIK